MNQLSNKIQVPIKTKIALIIMFLVGLVITTSGISTFIFFSQQANIQSEQIEKSWQDCPGCPGPPSVDYESRLRVLRVTIIPLGLLALIGAAVSFLWKKQAWKMGVITAALFEILSIPIISGILSNLSSTPAPGIIIVSLPSVLVFIALILLLSDRKNYFAAIDNWKK